MKMRIAGNPDKGKLFFLIEKNEYSLDYLFFIKKIICILTGLLSIILCINSKKMTENQLIKKIRDGNQKILAETYQRYRKEFVQWAYKKYNCPVEDGKELYQISFFIFYDNVISGKLEYMASHLKTYLFGIGKNKILENNRRNNRFSFDIKEEILKSEEDDQEIQDQKEYQYQQISEGLQKLGEPCKEILEMMYYHNCTIVDITKKFGYKNSDTAKNQKYKCMQRLKKIVEETTIIR
jgi:RNA polymerase sigma factor (sigma-70 family)